MLRRARLHSEEAGWLNHEDRVVETCTESMKQRGPERGEELRGDVISGKYTL